MSAPSVLLVCPDYASHFYPLSALGQACVHQGMSVTVATGPGLEPIVRRMGFAYESLVLGPGNNPGLLRVEAQRREETAHMQAFFDATAAGPIAALTYQTRARRHDMLHDPESVHARVRSIVESLRPSIVVTDQLSYSATLALHALGIPFVSFHPGNPHGVPPPGQPFGLPRRFPDCLEVPIAAVNELRARCAETERHFTIAFNSALASLAPGAPPVESAFRLTSDRLLLLNYPELLAKPYRGDMPASARFLGSSLRREEPDPVFAAALSCRIHGTPTVYVSLGTFLSAREDVMSRVVAALRRLPVNVILASGVANPTLWGELPDHWIVQPVVPQLAALEQADMAISHGGNNTVTEALTLGVPLLVGPMSSDQFDNAADLEDAGLGIVFPPNATSEHLLAGAVEELLANRTLRQRVKILAGSLQGHSGPERAAELLQYQEKGSLSA